MSSEGWHHVFVTYDGSRKAKGVKIYYDGEPQSVFEEVDSLQGSIRTKTPLRLNRRSTGEGAGGAAVHDVRFYRRALTAAEVQVLGRRDVLERVLAAPPDERTGKLLKPLRDYYLAFIDTEASRLRNARDAVVDEFEAVKARSKVTLIAQEKKGKDPSRTFSSAASRDQEGDRVGAAVPAVLPPLPTGAPVNRLGLARWLTQPEHPLTARVDVEPILGAGLRAGPRRHRRRVRHHRRASDPPEAARLAGRWFPRVGMGCEGPVPAHGDVRHVPSVRGGDPAEAGERRRQSPAFPGAALPDARRDDPGRRPSCGC